MSAKVAVAVPVWLVTVSVMSVKLTLTRVGVIGGGQSAPALVIGTVETVKVPLPDLVRKVVVPVAVVVVVCSPEGSWSFDPLLMQPVVTSAWEARVAVAVVPAPATSPLAVKVAELASLVAVMVGVPTKCRPPVLLVDVAAKGPRVTACAATAARAVTSSDSTAMMPNFLNIKVFLLYLVGLYCLSLSTYKDVFTLSS
jgi:hypothetical protein